MLDFFRYWHVLFVSFFRILEDVYNFRNFFSYLRFNAFFSNDFIFPFDFNHCKFLISKLIITVKLIAYLAFCWNKYPTDSIAEMRSTFNVWIKK